MKESRLYTVGPVCCAFFLLIVSGWSQKALTQGEGEATATPRIEFDGGVFELAFADFNQHLAINEYTLRGESLKRWSRLLTQHYYPKIDDAVALARETAKVVRQGNPDGLLQSVPHPSGEAAGLIFVAEDPQKGVRELNFFQYLSLGDGEGTLAKQYAIRRYLDEIPATEGTEALDPSEQLTGVDENVVGPVSPAPSGELTLEEIARNRGEELFLALGQVQFPQMQLPTAEEKAGTAEMRRLEFVTEEPVNELSLKDGAKEFRIDESFAAKHGAQVKIPFEILLPSAGQFEATEVLLSPPDSESEAELLEISFVHPDTGEMREQLVFAPFLVENVEDDRRAAIVAQLLADQGLKKIARGYEGAEVTEIYRTQINEVDAVIAHARAEAPGQGTMLMKLAGFMHRDSDEGIFCFVRAKAGHHGLEKPADFQNNGYALAIIHSFRFLDQKSPSGIDDPEEG